MAELLDPYQLAVDEMVVKFNHVITEHRTRDCILQLNLSRED